MQTVGSVHVHIEDTDIAPETSCMICIPSNQNDDIDLPTFAAISEGVVPESWTVSIIKRQLTNSSFKAKARAP